MHASAPENMIGLLDITGDQQDRQVVGSIGLINIIGPLSFEVVPSSRQAPKMASTFQ